MSRASKIAPRVQIPLSPPKNSVFDQPQTLKSGVIFLVFARRLHVCFYSVLNAMHTVGHHRRIARSRSPKIPQPAMRFH